MICSIEEIELPENRIEGVVFKPLKTFPDNRGFFREIVRHNDPFFDKGFAQWSHSKMAKNTVKAWHFHHKQVDWWYIGLGLVDAVLFDNRPDSSTYGKKIEFRLGDSELDENVVCVAIRIPCGVLHGLKVLSEFAHMFYITSETYDPKDEGRLPYNSPVVGQDWGDEKDIIVADNDRQEFIPPYPLSRD